MQINIETSTMTVECPKILTNVHRPHQQYPNTINNSLDHVDSDFSDLTATYISITIFGKVHRPCKKYPNILFFLVAWHQLPYWEMQ